jgi:GNAT superfamily N-acetyltransferase
VNEGWLRWPLHDGRAVTVRAEIALDVADDWQRLGLGTRLLHRLMSIARRQCVQDLFGDVLRDNAALRGERTRMQRNAA